MQQQQRLEYNKPEELFVFSPLFERSDSEDSMGSLQFDFSPSDEEIEIPPKSSLQRKFEQTPIFKFLNDS